MSVNFIKWRKEASLQLGVLEQVIVTVERGTAKTHVPKPTYFKGQLVDLAALSILAQSTTKSCNLMKINMHCGKRSVVILLVEEA